MAGGAVAYRITLADIAVSLMDAYVGAPASRRILDGAVERGVGEPIDAVLLMADLRGFTTLADTAGRDLIERLDEHLEAMAAPVLAQGGHVLKFLGDGLLAAFPTNDGLSRADACRQALAAAREALVLNDKVNRAAGRDRTGAGYRHSRRRSLLWECGRGGAS